MAGREGRGRALPAPEGAAVGALAVGAGEAAIERVRPGLAWSSRSNKARSRLSRASGCEPGHRWSRGLPVLFDALDLAQLSEC